MFRLVLLLVIFTLATLKLSAQDVEGFFTEIKERIANKDYFSASGRLSANGAYSAFFTENGAPRRQAPFTWGLNAGLVLDVLSIKAPFAAAVSSKNTTYNLPSYSFVGLSPTYRWVTLHGGDRNMTFSPYSLAGINYRGGGVELKPGRFTFQAMRGKLRRASIQDVGSIQNLETAFRRIGTGAKVGYRTESGSSFDVSVLHSSDRELNAPSEQNDDTLQIARPEQNLVLTAAASHKINKLIDVSFEYGRSILTRDVDAAPLADPNPGLGLFGLIDPNVTTTAANAYKIAVGLQPKFGRLSIAYERIDPGYRSHGALFFQNDFENFTAALSAPFFDGKVNLSVNGGVQRNDLDGQKASDLNRLIGAFTGSWQVNKRFGINLGASNFRNTTRVKAITRLPVIVDEVVLAQTQFSLTAGTSYLLTEDASQTLTLTSSWQRTNLIENEEVDTSRNTSFGLLLLNYSAQFGDSGSALGGAVMVNRNVTPATVLTTLGPSVNYQTQLFDQQVSFQSGLSYSRVFTGEAAGANGGVVQAQIGGGYRLGKRQSVQLSSTLLHAGDTAAAKGYTDFRLTLNYGYTFN